MLMGGMTHYLSTGERPEGRDWFFPKGPDGKRRAVPTYLRTIVSAYLHPVRTVTGITAPLNAVLGRLFITNESYSGEIIREPGDPFLKQAWDALKFATSEGYQPFVRQNIQRGEGSLESVLGISPAAAEIQRTAAENYLHEVMPQTPLTHDEAAHVQARRDFRTAVQGRDRAGAAAAAGQLSPRSLAGTVRTLPESPLQRAFKAATLAQAIHAYELAEPEERRAVLPLLLPKARLLIQEPDPARRADLAKRYAAALRLPLNTNLRKAQ
jgi:hypothetical protein